MNPDQKITLVTDDGKRLPLPIELREQFEAIDKIDFFIFKQNIDKKS